MSLSDTTLIAALDAAQRLIREAASTAVGDAATSLLNAMRMAPTYRDRNQLSSTQTHLLQNREKFLAAFATALREKVAAELGPKTQDRGGARETDWQAVSLVGEDQIEDRLSFERMGAFITHECEAELRELTSYTSAMLGHEWADPERNPLRGNVIGAALHDAIEAITDDSEVQRLLAKDIGQPMAKAMPACYRALIKDLTDRGARQADLAVRATAMPPGGGVGSSAGAQLAEARRMWEQSMQGRMPPPDAVDTLRSWESSILGRHGRIDPIPASFDPESSAALLDRLMRGGLPGTTGRGAPLTRGPVSAQADAELMSLLRRLNGGDTVRDDFGAESDTVRQPLDMPSGSGDLPGGSVFQGEGGSFGAAPNGFGELMAANLIRAHRDELQQASQGKLDHMVIEVVSSLFDQILSDIRVPPQMARQIARLQLPVLRVALKDTSFFSSRRHPVRRFINRVSTLATAFGEFDRGPGRELLTRVAALVKEIVDGDFDQIDVYSEKLLELEAFTADLAKKEVEDSAAADTLKVKELEWRVQRRFAQSLHAALEPLAMPAYLKEFLTQVWAQVILTAAQRDGADGVAERRFRRTAFDLVASIQPQRSPDQRAHFLATLPKLMGSLNDGLSLIELTAPARDAFFGRLFTDHAGSLKVAPGTELDHNMMLRHLEAAFRTPIPTGDDTDAPAEEAASALPVLRDVVVEQRFSADEASSVGLIAETAVDWATPIGPDAPASAAALDERVAAAPAVAPTATPAQAFDPDGLPPIAMPDAVAASVAAASFAPEGLEPMAADPDEPTEGPQLRHNLQIGVSYRLQLKDQWEKVRLTYMSPGRTLFLFSYGSKDRSSVSMTSRMLERLCDAHRLKTYEPSFLIDRAAERARRQLSALRPVGRPVTA